MIRFKDVVIPCGYRSTDRREYRKVILLLFDIICIKQNIFENTILTQKIAVDHKNIDETDRSAEERVEILYDIFFYTDNIFFPPNRYYNGLC